MKLITKKAILIGETNLCIQCAKHLIDSGWNIVFMVSDDNAVIDWAQNNSIAILPIAKFNTIKESNFYLFSIINPYLIPKSFLEDENVILALNYHDSPLPKYAGVNSTSWAIMHNEKTHGVTLHQIKPGIDNGDIAAQAIINIEANETVQSLNLKCSEQLLIIFRAVIAKIESDTLIFSKQSLDNRTYYGYKHIPDNYGLVNGISSLEALSSLTRGLTFGFGYDNQVATVKIFLDEKFYLLEDFNVTNISFDTVRDIYGNQTELKVTSKDILTDYKLSTDNLQYLSNIRSLERNHRKQILELLKLDLPIKILGHSSEEESRHKYTQTITIPEYINTNIVLTITYLVLARFFYDSDFLVALYAYNNTIPPDLQGMVESRNFIHISSDKLSCGVVYLEDYLVQLQKNCHLITKDFDYRYNLQLLTDIAITIGKARHINKHKIIISIENNKFIIAGLVTYKLQIDSIIKSIENLLSKDTQALVAQDLTKVNILSDMQYQKVVYEFNQTDNDYPKNKTIHQLFEKQVLKTPNSIAVVFEDTKLTYQELNNQANQLAHYLIQNYNIKPDDLVMLCLDRNEQMLIAMLGVLKSGGAYVPIDPSHPDERIGYVLNDANAKIILTNQVYIDRLQQIAKQKANPVDVLSIDNKELLNDLNNQKHSNPITSTTSSNLIYVIYTSGTTGQPKGVMIEHSSVANCITYIISRNKLNDKSASSQYSSFGFDALVIEVYPILLVGGILYIVPHECKLDIAQMNDFFYTHKITHGFLPTKFAELFFNLKNNSLTSLIVAGEKLEKFSSQAYRVSNGYGPTENTVYTTNFITDKQYNNIPIGKPINNVKCYVVDGKLNILSIGAIGELMIGGAGLARGYLNHPNLTTEKFIANPFQTPAEKAQNKNSRLYKTGDLVRWLPDGNLEYIGRNDFQVKIRGYRIELGEIENKLMNYSGIKNVVLLAKERTIEQASDKYLLAYYVAPQKLDANKLHVYLSAQLPEYMLPNAYIHINELPLTVNGKLDKKALPEPEFVIMDSYTAPVTQLQNQISEIWAELLNIPQTLIGITNNFFSLGGNSILAINLAIKLTKIPACSQIRAVDIFKYTTIEQLTDFLSKHKADDQFIQTKPKNILDHEIAIVATSGAFSGANNIQQYWELIQQGLEGVKRHTIAECQSLDIPEEILVNPNFVPTSGHIPNIEQFDAAFWGLSPSESETLDPQVRKFLEHSWYVLEESGYLTTRSQINIGVFAGAGNSFYNSFNNSLNSRDFKHLSAKEILATKISHLLGLVGPAININTACSTSLVAVIEGCIHLASGYCDMAIAGGVSLLLPEEVGHIYQDGMIYSKDGYCRAFDQQASGIVHGSGVGVVLLKRLSDAIRDNDSILAVIKGYSSNNDGDRKMSYTSPSATGQTECIINAQQMAGIDANAIDYVECHGTGTKLGDPIEIQALNEAFKYNNHEHAKYQCVLGSVKSNIGHADIAAGIAGLIKVCKMLEHQLIPKQINYTVANQELHLEETNFIINTVTKRWKQKKHVPRIAGISSFGIGGTNAHIIVSEYIKSKTNQAVKTQACSVIQSQAYNYILPLSAKSPAALERYKQGFINYLAYTKDNIKNIAYTLQLRREHFDYRLAIVCDSPITAIKQLKLNAIINRSNNQKQQNIVFMFPGQGNQYANMSLALYQREIVYKQLIDECIKLANQYTNLRFEQILFPALFSRIVSAQDINQANWAQLALFIVEYALAKFLETLNIRAVSYLGHSIGEYVAATLAGVFSLADVIKLIVARGQLMQAMPVGAMLAIQADVTTVVPIISQQQCEIAVINSPKNCIATGLIESITRLNSELSKMGIPATLLRVSHAYHSRIMTEAAQEFITKFDQVNLNKPQTKFISNVTGKFITDSEATSPAYWAEHMYNTVLFSTGIKTLLKSCNNLLFMEVGPGKSAISFVKHHDGYKYNLVQLLNSNKDHHAGVMDTNSKESILSKLWTAGYNLRFNDYYTYQDNITIARLPVYQFDNSVYWRHNINLSKVLPNAALLDQTLDLNNIKTKVLEPDQPDQYYAIAKIFLEVLGIEQISIHDDFFALGGDSLLAVGIVAKLQQNYQISMDDFLKFPSVSKVAETAVFVKNNLKSKLEQIKILYAKRATCSVCDTNDMINKQADYLHDIEKLSVSKQKKNIRSVLLTGSTGHVGCNILYQLLHETTHKIYLLIRAATFEESFVRINNKYKYYFNVGLDAFKDRIIFLPANIEKQNLGLSLVQYQNLIANIDSIIHSAALVRHYKHYNESYKANVQSTINLLELSKLTTSKDFHYISTIGVLAQDGYVPNRSYFIFHEDDDAGILLERNNSYAKTKYEGELATIKYREYGVKSNIYRLGNVAMHSTNYKHQENIKDNAFFIQLKTFLSLGMIYNDAVEVEISPVDLTAQAIVTLFDKTYLSNQIYHIFNPYLCNLSNVFIEHKKRINVYSIDEFIDTIVTNFDNNIVDSKQIELFMLHQKWFEKVKTNNITQIKILQDKTSVILAKLGFYWSKVNKNMWSDIIKKASML